MDEYVATITGNDAFFRNLRAAVEQARVSAWTGTPMREAMARMVEAIDSRQPMDERAVAQRARLAGEDAITSDAHRTNVQIAGDYDEPVSRTEAERDGWTDKGDECEEEES